MEENNWYIYRHLKPNGEVFYIGIGHTKNFKRAYSVKDRNRYWNFVNDKYGREVQVLKKNMSLSEANELEMVLISYYKRKNIYADGTLVNLTDGGNAVIGLVFTQEHKDKISKGNKGNRGMIGVENHQFGKIGVLNHNYGKPHSEERKKAQSLNMKGRMAGDKNPMFGRSGKDAPAYGRTGDKHPLFGTKLSDETKEKKRQSMLKNGRNKGSLNGTAKIVINTITFEEIGSAKELSENLNINYSTLQNMLSGRVKNKTHWKYKSHQN